MRLTEDQQRVHHHRCLQFDRAWLSDCPDAVLREIVASAAAGNHDGERTWRVWSATQRGRTTTGRTVSILLQAVAEEVERRASHPRGAKLPMLSPRPLL